MANEQARRDQNVVTTLLGVTDDANEEIRNLLIDPSTGRLKVTATLAVDLNGLSDVDIDNPQDGEVLTYDSASGDWVNSSGASGDVSGPASSTDNAVARFDGTGGKTIQNSGIIIDDSDNMTGGNVGGMELAQTGSPTYSTVQHLMNLGVSAGHASGGTISDAGSGNIDVAAGTGFIRSSDDDVSEISFFDWSASNGNAIPSGATRYVGVEYNAGSPQVTIRSSQNWNYDTDFPLGRVVNEGGTLYIMNDPWQTGDPIGNIIERFDATGYIARDDRTGGLVVSNTGTRNVAVSAGTLLSRLSEYDVSAIDTSGSDTFDAYYRDGSGSFTKQADQSQWNNTQYDNGSGTLQGAGALAPFMNRWWYLTVNGELIMLYGRDDYSSVAAALDEDPPSTIPERVNELGILIGRFIITDGNNTPNVVQTAFNTAFNPSAVTDHNQLGTLGWSSSAHTGTADTFASFDGSGDAESTKSVPSGDVVGTTDTQTMTNKTLGATTLSGTLTAGDNDISGAGDIDYDTATGAVSALGNLGATETIDWDTATHFTGTLDSDVTISHSNETSGRKITLALAYDGSAQRTITWSDVDSWEGGSAPDAPSSAGEELVVTMVFLGTTCYASGAIFS